MRAFTLIELLVVISILALLTAIVFPVFASARRKAHLTTDAANMQQLGQTFRTYCADYDDVMPFAVTNYQQSEAAQGRVSFWNYNDEICEVAKICTTADVLKTIHIKTALTPYGVAEKQWESPLDFITEKDRKGFIGTYKDTWYATTGSSYAHDWANALRGKRLSEYEEPSHTLLFWSQSHVQEYPILWHTAYADGHIKVTTHEAFYTALEVQNAGY